MMTALPIVRPKSEKVPCNGCTACCRNGSVIPVDEPGDRPKLYQTIVENYCGQNRVVLKRKPNGDCIYVGERGCMIWHKRPSVCRFFDCRQAILLGYEMDKHVVLAAVERMNDHQRERVLEMLQEQRLQESV